VPSFDPKPRLPFPDWLAEQIDREDMIGVLLVQRFVVTGGPRLSFVDLLELLSAEPFVDEQIGRALYLAMRKYQAACEVSVRAPELFLECTTEALPW
jgi:hypothetical protein